MSSARQLKDLYERNMMPSKTAFKKIAKEHGYSPKEVDEFIAKQSEQQIFQKPISDKKNTLQCTSYDYCLSIDLMDFSRYAQQNGNYKWILTAIDWRTRYGFAVPLKRKYSTEVAPALVKIIESLPHYKDAYIRIISDQGSEFQGAVQTELDRLPSVIFRLWNIPNKRKSSVLVERFNGTLLKYLSRIFEHNKNFKWVSILPALVKRYNSVEHSTTLGKLVPATELERLAKLDKMPDISIDLDSRAPESPFKVGDYVRKLEKKDAFAKKTLAPTWSSKVYLLDSKAAHDHTLWRLRDLKTNKLIAESFLDSELLLSESPSVYQAEPDILKQDQDDTEAMLKNNRIRQRQNRSNIKASHEVKEIQQDGTVVFKDRLKPASEKRAPSRRS